MHCNTCGAELIPDARFCTRCGAKVELAALLGVGTDLPVVPALPAVPAVPAVPAEPPAMREPQRSEGHHRSSGNFTPGRIAAMVATFVVLTILGTFALSQLFGSDVPDPVATSASTDPGQATASPSDESSPEPPLLSRALRSRAPPVRARRPPRRPRCPTAPGGVQTAAVTPSRRHTPATATRPARSPTQSARPTARRARPQTPSRSGPTAP
ncbi:zinc ribbon domain-containing protein [Knoellia sp. CPCC 206453]|uniref:zinc ribbon domain-containing protein n=1 Tax=Knoellia pratensis TaxID=3404796 RepID=UPI0036093DC1